MLKIKLLIGSTLLFSNLMTCDADKDKIVDKKSRKEKIVLISKIATVGVAAVIFVKMMFKISNLNSKVSRLDAENLTLKSEISNLSSIVEELEDEIDIGPSDTIRG